MANLIKKYRYDLFVLLVLFAAAVAAYIMKDEFNVFADREEFERLIAQFGIWGPLVVIGAITLEVIVAPIPGYIPAIAAGFAFGPLWGTIYVFLGNVLGTAIVFLLARKFGRMLVEKFVDKQRLGKYEQTIAKHENWLLFFYFVPVIPIDVISAAFGLSKIKLKKFFLVSSVGYIAYSLVSTNFGDYLARLWF